MRRPIELLRSQCDLASPGRSRKRGCRGSSGCRGARGRGSRSKTGSSSAYRSRAVAGSPASPVQRARLPRAVRVLGCSRPRTRSSTVSNSAYRSRAAAGSPASPVQRARLPRAVTVSGWSAPRTRSKTGSSFGELVTGSRWVPASPVQRATLRRALRVSRVLGAEDPLPDGQQLGVQVPRGGVRPRPPRSSGRACRGRCRVSGCSGPRTRSKTGSSSAYWSRAAGGVPSSPGPVGEVGAGGQGVGVLGAEDLLLCAQDLQVELTCRGVAADLPQVFGDFAHAVAVGREAGLDVCH